MAHPARLILLLVLAVVAAACAGDPPQPPQPERTRVGVHYFTWYRRTDGAPWGNGMTSVPASSPRPALGWYNSNDKEVMDAHISGMERAGFDFAIVNVTANSPPSWENAHRFVARLSGHPLQMVMMIDGLHDAPSQEKAGWVTKVKDEFAAHPSYVRLGGEPLVLLFSARIDFESSGLSLRNVYWTPDYVDGRNTFNGGPLLPRDWPFWMPSPQAALNGIVPVIPGYSDGHLQRPVSMEHPRADGALYHQQWQRALALRPGLVLVYSWNEYFEQTMIESTDTWGDQYVDWTACYTALARAGKTGQC